ncbi:transcription-repair coupling factor [Exiguobacterium sp. BMC-KP]|uniref:transcription-repair coupling factor n=1 Tax=Exiguobacterium sp. BMC-KP TaxID=1684312 RepID=UPI0006AA526E|nr:transcription-repair coupling factor [Exiguobacterium sp. BMC-KP]KOP28404.1 transcription-repair coupling factor [Exiguobacterium sp. BMC-KP]
MKQLQELLLAIPEIKTVRERFRDGVNAQLITGLMNSGKALFVAGIYQETKRRFVLVTHNMFQAQKLYDDLIELVPEEDVMLYPVDETLAAELSYGASPELRATRIETRHRLLTTDDGILIIPLVGLRRYVPDAQTFLSHVKQVKPGDILSIPDFVQDLVDAGYERTATVTTPGEFAVRGSIIDIYPLTVERPYRLDLFDEEVDSIYTFDAETQRSLGVVAEACLMPAAEHFATKDQLKDAGEKVRRLYEATKERVQSTEVLAALEEGIAYDVELLENGDQPKQFAKYAPILYTSTLRQDVTGSVLIVDEVARVEEAAEVQDAEEAEWMASLIERGQSVSDYVLSVPMAHVFEGQPLLYLSLLPTRRSGVPESAAIHFSIKPIAPFHGQMERLKQEVERYRRADMWMVFLASNRERAERMRQTLSDYGVEASIVTKEGITRGQPAILIGGIHGGFEMTNARLVVITEEEVFKQPARRRKQTTKLTNAERIKSYQELKTGDYVVHIHHGIGRYHGIKTIDVAGNHQDYLHLVYAGEDSLYVPVDQIDLIQKYVGAEGKEPKIYKLGGTEWKKVKAKVQKSVEDIADELIKLYAAREAAVGFAFPEDDDNMQAFEASFPYEETVDQLRSIAEIKKDMERPRPMDRLLCGDVGYGKTEVAIRAAFKAVMSGKQVALLVPTTVLAQQHYETMLERFSEWPIRVSVMSRFRSPAELKATKQGLKEGTIDVVVGTHRVLSKDVQFADIGLLIIDEEQRFGVKHKERLKQLKTNVDVLTLTATPIPRTLHMSMIGIRDLSVLETPPENRYPVQTYVMEYDGIVMREALERELGRGGQAFFLYNRVEGIERKAEEIRALVPEARIVTAHGRMTETELESQLIAFFEGDADVLVSTTIIETGIDIPNVNTLIVHDADQMGLSQLYQLRGRVGRSSRVAYSYFTYRPQKRLTEVAESRLQAIKEFTELGSGFKIAMRDLSIRGAGNLLGSQQSGFIDSVGFDLYSQMLAEAVEERKERMKGKKRVQKFVPEFTFSLDAYIPSHYMTDSELKIEFYKRLKYVDTVDSLEQLETEMLERFGEFPDEVARLIQLTRMRIFAERARVERVKQTEPKIEIVLSLQSTQQLDVADFVKWTVPLGRGLGMGQQEQKLVLTLNRNKQSTQQMTMQAEQLLAELDRRLVAR